MFLNHTYTYLPQSILAHSKRKLSMILTLLRMCSHNYKIQTKQNTHTIIGFVLHICFVVLIISAAPFQHLIDQNSL